jgi:outer membrane protein assembly factor BamB
MKSVIAVVAATWVASIGLGAEPLLAWPRFRGPNGSGVADDQVPPIRLGPETNVKWKVNVPEGLSSPIIAGANVVITAFENGRLYTIAYRRSDGKEVWRKEAPARQIEKYYKGEGSPAASTPATDGQRIVSYFASCGLLCYDLDGEQIWRYPMPTAVLYTATGSGVSPILADGLVLLVRDEAQGSRIVALSLADGSLRWERPRQSTRSFCTPVVWETPKGKHVVAAGQGQLIGYDLESGEEKWFVNGTAAKPCPSPVVADRTLFFASWSAEANGGSVVPFDDLLKETDTNKDGVVSKVEFQKITDLKDDFDSLDLNHDGVITRAEWDRFRQSLYGGKSLAVAVSPGGTGDISRSHVIWQKTKGVPNIATAIIYRGQVVMVKDGGLVTAYDQKTGSEVYTLERVGAIGRYYASPIAANGYIYLTSLEDGVVTVLKAGTAKPEVVVKNPELGERVTATPAIADNTIYLRTATKLYAFAEGK